MEENEIDMEKKFQQKNKSYNEYFKGEYLNGKRWNGIIERYTNYYDYDNNNDIFDVFFSEGKYANGEIVFIRDFNKERR